MAAHSSLFMLARPRLDWLHEPGTSNHHDAGVHTFFLLDQFGFEQFQLQSNRARLRTPQEVEAFIRPPIGQ